MHATQVLGIMRFNPPRLLHLPTCKRVDDGAHGRLAGGAAHAVCKDQRVGHALGWTGSKL